MGNDSFHTPSGISIPSVTSEEMREIDRIAVEDVGLTLLQMMEHAGRTLAWQVRTVTEGSVVVVAGSGGNGGGGLVCARHLANHDVPVEIVLDRSPEDLTGAAAHQYQILDEMDVPAAVGADEFDRIEASATIVDALIGYGLSGDVRGSTRTLIQSINDRATPVISLDVPSGIDATSGETLGTAVCPDRTITLALPKTGLARRTEPLILADISIPTTVYRRLGIEYENPFVDCPWVELVR